MSHNEIEACVIRAKSGCQEDLLKLLNQYKPFIYKMANHSTIMGCDTYDLLQVGYIAIINAVTKYKTGSHTFSSYAFTSIKNAFRHTARKNKRCAADLSLNTPVDSEDGINSEFIDCIESGENIEESILNSENAKKVRNAVAKLPEDEVELIIMVYYSDISLKAYADKKGINYLQAFNKKNRILRKLRRSITNSNAAN